MNVGHGRADRLIDAELRRRVAALRVEWTRALERLPTRLLLEHAPRFIANKMLAEADVLIGELENRARPRKGGAS